MLSTLGVAVAFYASTVVSSCPDVDNPSACVGDGCAWRGSTSTCQKINPSATCSDNTWHKDCQDPCVWKGSTNECISKPASCDALSPSQCNKVSGCMKVGASCLDTATSDCSLFNKHSACKMIGERCGWHHTVSPRVCKPRGEMPCSAATKEASCGRWNSFTGQTCAWNGSACV